MSCQSSPSKYSAELAPTTMQDKEQTEALTGRILHTDANASEFIQQSKRTQLKEWLSKPSVWQVAAVVALLALLGTVIGLAVSLSQRSSSNAIDPACIHALGGGPVKLGGGLDMYSIAPPYCQEQLHAYADSRRGSYWRVRFWKLKLADMAWQQQLCKALTLCSSRDTKAVCSWTAVQGEESCTAALNRQLSKPAALCAQRGHSPSNRDMPDTCATAF